MRRQLCAVGGRLGFEPLGGPYGAGDDVVDVLKEALRRK